MDGWIEGGRERGTDGWMEGGREGGTGGWYHGRTDGGTDRRTDTERDWEEGKVSVSGTESRQTSTWSGSKGHRWREDAGVEVSAVKIQTAQKQ